MSKRTPVVDGKKSFPVSEDRIQAHWTELCVRIGERRAGSRGDQVAIDYMLAHFEKAGLSNVHPESFPCVSVVSAEADVAIGAGSRFARVPARVLAGSPATPGRGAIAADLVWIEMPEQADRLIQPTLRGKAVALFGPLPTRADLHRRLVECAPAFVIHVDDRLPFEWVKDDGVYPSWVRRYGMPPIVTVPYRVAWELRKQEATRARARLVVELKQTTSLNVVGEIAGRCPDLPIILVGAHHDTQCHNAGADDNGSGVVALLELASLLASTEPLRTIRLVCFGAEEQLSVGSAAYVGAHRREMASIGAVINIDSVSSPLGHHWVFRAGSDEFGRRLLTTLARAGLDAVEKTAAMPFADHFPFSVFGIPSATLMRPNMDSGLRWQHHSEFDRLDNVSVPVLAQVIGATAQVVTMLAGKRDWPFPSGLAPDQQADTMRLARDLYDLKAPAPKRQA